MCYNTVYLVHAQYHTIYTYYEFSKSAIIVLFQRLVYFVNIGVCQKCESTKIAKLKNNIYIWIFSKDMITSKLNFQKTVIMFKNNVLFYIILFGNMNKKCPQCPQNHNINSQNLKISFQNPKYKKIKYYIFL